MARRPQFRDEDILEAARAVFLAHGVRATTAEVASRAGVSEGTLFHRFKTKEALFRAALNPALDEPAAIAALPGRIGRGEVGENLTAFINVVIESLRVRVPFIMMAWSNRSPDGVSAICDLEPSGQRIIRALAAYLDGELRLGRIRRVDPEIATHALVGPIFDYVMTEILHGTANQLPLPAAMYVRGLVDIFLNGVAPRKAPPSAARHRR